MHRKFTLTILYLAATVGSFSSILHGQVDLALPALAPGPPIAPDLQVYLPEGQSFFPSAGLVALRGSRTDQAMAKAIEKYKKSENDSDARRQAKDEISKLLSEQYDAYMKDQEKHLEQMEQKLAKLRDQLKLRKDGKQKMVGLKLEMVMAQIEGLGWPENASGGWLASPLQSRYQFGTSSQNVAGLLESVVGDETPPDAVETMEAVEAEEEEAEAPRPTRGRGINRSR